MIKIVFLNNTEKAAMIAKLVALLKFILPFKPINDDGGIQVDWSQNIQHFDCKFDKSWILTNFRQNSDKSVKRQLAVEQKWIITKLELTK